MTKKVFLGVLLAVVLTTVGPDISITWAAREVSSPPRPLKAASELDYPPFAMVRPDGSADGFSVELLRAVVAKTGMEIDIAVGPWHEIKQKLAEGRLDVLPLVSYSEERDRVYDFTVPYLEMHGTVFVRRGETSIRSEADLKDKEVLVMSGDTAHEYAVRNNLSTRLILTETYGEAFSLLSRGRHDAVLSQHLMGLQLIKDLGITNVVSLAGAGEQSLKLSGRQLGGFGQKFCFAVGEGDRELLAHLNEGLAIVFSDGTYNSLYDKWFGQLLPRQQSVSPVEIAKYLLFILLPLLLLVAVATTLYLRREVARKTATLQKAKEKIMKSEEEYRGLFSRMHDGFALHEIICDDAGRPVDYRFLRVNPAFERLTGLRAGDLLGRTVLEVLPGTEKHWIDIYGKIALTGDPVTFENYSAELDKHFAVTAYQPAERQFAAIFHDITSRKKAEEERRELEAQLRQSHKMEAVGTMAGGVAHDFNNILAIIFGNAEMALDDIPSGSPARQNVEDVLAAADRAKKLVRQILAFSRKEQSELMPIRPQSLINETLKLLRSTTPATVSIIQETSQDCGLILADPPQLHQLLMNLFANAVHAMDEKGSITVSLQEVQLNRADLATLPISSTAFTGAPGMYVKLSVTDDGTGMDGRTIERIFDPFFTTKEVGKGTGMGLSVVHGIVKSHGGFINVRSEPGRGSSFNVFFPVTTKEEIFDFDVETAVQTGTERILLLDDEESILKMAKRMLEGLGYSVRAESSSLEALDVFRSNPDSFDLVITDQSMPNMSGSELIVEILKIRPAMPIILCTGYSSKVSEENAREQGISKYINKPYGKRSLSEAVREVLDAKL